MMNEMVQGIVIGRSAPFVEVDNSLLWHLNSACSLDLSSLCLDGTQMS
jgi:hypothetical protein